MRRAFTLLEVVVGLGILGLGLMVLVETQMSSLMSSVEADRMSRAQQLANEKMLEIKLLVEVEGFTESDKGEQGSFEDFGDESWRGDSLGLDAGEGEFDGYYYAWTLRRIELTIPTDLTGVVDDLSESGLLPENESQQDAPESQSLDISSFISSEQITEYLAGYMRELRVVVWWGSEEPDIDGAGGLPEDSIELLTHIINPTGEIKPILGG